VQTIKSITARQILKRIPSVKETLWGGEFWSKGYFISTIGKYSDEETMKNYVKNQAKNKQYNVLHQQLKLW